MAPHSPVPPSSAGASSREPPLSPSALRVPLHSALWLGGPALVLTFGLLSAGPGVGFSDGSAGKKELLAQLGVL